MTADTPLARVGGVLLRVGGVLRFIKSAVALRVASIPRLTPLPGAPPELLGVGVHEGAILAVVSIGSARGEMIVCQHAGEVLGVVGGEVLRAGLFDAVPDRPDMVQHEGERVPPLDVSTIYEHVVSSARAGRRLIVSVTRDRRRRSR